MLQSDQQLARAICDRLHGFDAVHHQIDDHLLQLNLIGENDRERLRLSGEPRSPIDPDPNVCRFYGRCPRGTDVCKITMPPLRRFGDRAVACHFAEEFLPQP